ncbi:MAG TPA: hypothetical protein VND45_12260 [Thermoanaerobaculia bacterium]|jgi:uncharacterized cupredoxin-like copper-binding protein|nr:hypothetical protein [Thermoanaerobaculia bacterium]
MKHLLVASLLVLTLACKKATDETPTLAGTPADTAATAVDTATHPASPGGAALVPEVASGTTVLVMISDGSIAVREQSIPAGPAILSVENRGTGVHNLYVEGEGISRAAGNNIDAGGSATVDVNFKAGNYVLYCPVLNHREKGEQVSVTVGGAAPTTDTSGTMGTTTASPAPSPTT